MNVAHHRIAAGALLVCASLGVGAVGRALVRDSPAMAAARQQLAGRWVATRVQSSAASSVEGPEAAVTTVEFAGPTARFRGLIDAADTAGTYVVEPAEHPERVDFKVAAGWLRGTYRLEGDRLILCLNALRPLEQLGVPSRGYPARLLPGEGHLLYEFRRATP